MYKPDSADGEARELRGEETDPRGVEVALREIARIRVLWRILAKLLLFLRSKVVWLLAKLVEADRK